MSATHSRPNHAECPTFPADLDPEGRFPYGLAAMLRALTAILPLTLYCLCAAPELLRAEPPSELTPQDGVALLRSGEVLLGRVTPAGDYYYVTQETSEIRLVRAEVVLVGRSLEEVYEYRHQQIAGKRPGYAGADDHLELANWCLQYELYGCAARELTAAMQLAPSHPRLPVVERRLQLAVQPPAPAAQPRPVPKASIDDEIAAVAQSVSPECLEVFSRTIQPLLLNHCTGSKCHSPGQSSEFSLQRVDATALSRRITLQNLQSALAQVDRESPSRSKLTMTPARPHGGMNKPMFEKHELDQYQQLLQWVASVAGSKAPPPAVLPTATLQQARPLNPPVAGGTIAARGSDPTWVDPQVVPATATEPIAPPSKAEPPKFTPRDEFDPELFNRQFAR